MANTTTTPRDAIIFVPGLSAGEDDLTLEGAADRLAAALDHAADTPAARFTVSEGEKLTYGEGHFEAQRMAIHRLDGDSVAPAFDLYELDYRSSLTATYKTRSPARQAWSILWLVMGNSWRFIPAVRERSKSGIDKLQLAIATSLLGVIALYLGLLIATAVGTTVEIIQATSGTSPAEQSAPQPPAEGEAVRAAPGQTGEAAGPGELEGWLAGTQATYQSSLRFLQLSIVVLTGLGMFRRQTLKQTITELGVEYASVIDYLAGGLQRRNLRGQFRDMLEGIAALEISGSGAGQSVDLHGKVHVLAYSFGSIVALDGIFRPNQPDPQKRFERIGSFVTVGSPFDIVRAFWPRYFADRRKPTHAADLNWLNVYCRDDVLSSNFRNDDNVMDSSTEALDELRPKNTAFPLVTQGEKPLGVIERLRRARYLHAQYWGPTARSDTFLNDLVPKMFAGSAVLR